MTKKVHNTVWRAPDASNVGLDHLKPGFQQVAELLFFQYAGILPYKSRDMQVGIYTGSLVVFAQFIRHCILVDGRGGYFLQQDMEVMYESVANDPKYKAAFECAACNDKKTTEEFRYDQAYCLRVMLSHFRLKYDAWKKAKAKDTPAVTRSHPPELQELYKIMDEHIEDEPAKKKENPFFLFRSESSSEESAQEHEDEIPRPVLYSFDPAKRVSYRRMSDGTEELASSYTEGGDGFVIACWHDGAERSIPPGIVVGSFEIRKKADREPKKTVTNYSLSQPKKGDHPSLDQPTKSPASAMEKATASTKGRVTSFRPNQKYRKLRPSNLSNEQFSQKGLRFNLNVASFRFRQKRSPQKNGHQLNQEYHQPQRWAFD